MSTGPHPVTDTHPHCRCERIPFASRNALAALAAAGLPVPAFFVESARFT